MEVRGGLTRKNKAATCEQAQCINEAPITGNATWDRCGPAAERRLCNDGRCNQDLVLPCTTFCAGRYFGSCRNSEIQSEPIVGGCQFVQLEQCDAVALASTKSAKVGWM